MIPAISGAIGPLGASEWSVGRGRLGRLHDGAPRTAAITGASGDGSFR